MSANQTKIWLQKQKERERTLRKMEKTAPAAALSKFSFPLLLIIGFVVALSVAGFFTYQNLYAETPLEVDRDSIYVRAGGDLQAALNRAKPGDTILLQAGASFRGSFNLPFKEGTEFITIRTSAADALLPPADTRIDPTKYASVLPKLFSTTTEPVINAKDAAHHYRFIGVEFGGTKDGFYNIIQIGTTEEKRVQDLPHHIEFDRVYIHSTSPLGQRRGIAANGKHIRIVNSHISGIRRKGEESQAICVWATDGPIEIVNNYLEAAAENILFGGGSSVLKLVPADVVVRGNHLNKLIEWRDEGWDVKNLFEIKFGRRFKIENNLMTNNWGMAQDGTAVVFTTRTDNGASDIIEDIEFSGNIVRGSGNALNIYGPEAQGGHRLTIRNNIFEDINGEKWNGGGNFMKVTAWNGLVIENNTIINSGNIAFAYDAPVRGFVFRNNIVFENEYGMKGDGLNSGITTIDRFFPGSDISFNAVIGGAPALYRGKNLYPASIKQIGLVNPEKNDYRLLPNSPLRGKGASGKTIGADLNYAAVGGK